MFKSARWRSEKVKIKAVFKLQFRVTKVAAGDALLISVVPADVGKPTVKLEKAKVQDGSCFWENAVYETMKLTRDPKSGKIHERIYNFIVATGSLKSGIVGEATIDFSSYAETTKVSSVSLPLKNSKTGAMLHVSIQRIHDSFNQSVNHESETVKPDAEDKTLKEKLNEDMDECYEDNPVNETQINRNLSLVGMNVGRTSSESDITLSSSDSSSGLDTPHEFEAINNNCLKVQNSLLLSSPNNGLSHRSQCEWLTRQAEVCDLELQTLRKQIIKESKRSQDLSREMVIVIEERDALKEECEKLKASRRRLDDAKCKDELLDGRDVHTLVHELRQELNYHKDLNANLQIRLEKTQESNSELILAVRDLEELLEQKDKEITKLSSNSENISRLCLAPGKCVTGNTSYKDDGDEEQKTLEQLVRHHGDGIESYELEQKIMDLENELEIYRRDKDELESQMEQLALDYEILKQENHHLLHKLEQSQLQEQLNMQCECSSGSYAQIDALEEELEKRAQQFETNLEVLSNAKVEQEKRAICAEEELRKTRLQNAKTAEKLQKELKRLSVQIASTFQANEKLATKALTEANELRLEKSQLENELVSMHKKVEECIEGMNNMTRLMNEKDTLVAALRLEMVALREQHSELNSRMSEDELEKDKLREEVSNLKSDLKKKEDTLRACSRKDKCTFASHEVTSLKEKIKLLEGQIKMKENALETSTNSYLEKEKDLQNKIEELETRIEELNQNTASLCEHMSQKEGTEDFDLISGTSETRNSNNELWDEVRLLRERKGIMEAELKEMQERYSEISLKFAEVEGERQQLVMKVRNLKSAKKSP